MLPGSARFGLVAKILHWAMAVPIIALLLLGQHTMGNHYARFLPTLHASAGLLIIVLVGFRLYWRWQNPQPPHVALKAWEQLASRLVHVALYLAMFLIPLTGWLTYTEHVTRSLGVRPASWFGFRIPLLPDFGINWHFIHNWGGKLALLLIVLHAVAALKHHFFDGNSSQNRLSP